MPAHYNYWTTAEKNKNKNKLKYYLIVMYKILKSQIEMIIKIKANLKYYLKF